MAVILAVHAHPDDLDILAGGTLAILASMGHRVRMVTANGGRGKVTMNLQQRTMEFPAITHGPDALAAGRRVIIVDYQDPDLMEVVAEDKYIPPIDEPL